MTTEQDTGQDKAPEKDIFLEAQEFFQRASEYEADNRQQALDDWRFARNSEQWPETVRKDREDDGRPCLTINRMPAFIRQVVNDARQNKPAIKVHPVDDRADVETAEVFNGLIRNIEVTSNADISYDTAIDCAVTGGFGYLRAVIDYAHDDSFDLDLLIQRVQDPFSVYGDPEGCAGDGSDWNQAMVTSMIPKKEFKERWPKADPAEWQEAGIGDQNRQDWIDEDSIRIAEYWCRREVERTIVKLSDGSVRTEEDYLAQEDQFIAAGLEVVESRDARGYQVTQYWVGGGQVLETVDWPGKFIPIVPVYGDEYWIEGKMRLKSLIRDAKDPQRNFNYWRSSATESIALAPKTPFIGKAGAFDTDEDKWATANVKNHAYIEYDGDLPPQRQPFAGVPAGALQEGLNATDDMKSVMGIHDASLGARSNETSGKAILARQREGDVSTFHFIDNMTRAIRQMGKVLVDLAPKVYNKTRVLRIMGEDQTPQNVLVGAIDQMPGGPERIYDLTAGKYDVTVQSGPSYTTKREELVNSLAQLLQGSPNVAPLVMDVFVKNQDWPEADLIARRFKAMLPPQIQAMENGQQEIPPQALMAIQQKDRQLQMLAQQVQALQQQLQKSNAAKSQAEMIKAQTDAHISDNDLQQARIESVTRAQESQNQLQESYLKAATPKPIATQYPTV